ncbi:MAG: trypsin-like peptidase domain-containing protein [Xanthomonadales bacterium]|nr:trypsin-like peptidase domain-containing protein [Xanthomonadales bacterium]
MTEIETKKLEILEREVSVKEKDLDFKIQEAQKSAWKSPLVVAIFVAAASASGNALVTYLSSSWDREAAADEYSRTATLAQSGAERARILEMIKIGDPNQVQRNLEFLIDAGLVTDPDTIKSIREYYQIRAPGTGPGASTSIDHSFSAPESNPAVFGCGTDIRFVPGNNASPSNLRVRLADIAAATGRIEVSGHPYFEWVGSGFLIAPNTFLTARHVIEAVTNEGVIPSGVQVTINFDANIGCFDPRRASVEEILYVSDAPDRDFALLRVAFASGENLLAVATQVEIPEPGHTVGLVSHPTTGLHRDPADLLRAFGEILAVKRLSVGEMFRAADVGLAYGLFSSGGSGGGPIVDLETGNVFAMHVAARAGEGGFGLAIASILEIEEVRILIDLQNP